MPPDTAHVNAAWRAPFARRRRRGPESLEPCPLPIWQCLLLSWHGPLLIWQWRPPNMAAPLLIWQHPT
eukprot:1106299-Prymnesium_polylepis.1